MRGVQVQLCWAALHSLCTGSRDQEPGQAGHHTVSPSTNHDPSQWSPGQIKADYQPVTEAQLILTRNVISVKCNGKWTLNTAISTIYFPRKRSSIYLAVHCRLEIIFPLTQHSSELSTNCIHCFHPPLQQLSPQLQRLRMVDCSDRRDLGASSQR